MDPWGGDGGESHFLCPKTDPAEVMPSVPAEKTKWAAHLCVALAPALGCPWLPSQLLRSTPHMNVQTRILITHPPLGADTD